MRAASTSRAYLLRQRVDPSVRVQACVYKRGFSGRDVTVRVRGGVIQIVGDQGSEPIVFDDIELCWQALLMIRPHAVVVQSNDDKIRVLAEVYRQIVAEDAARAAPQWGSFASG